MYTKMKNFKATRGTEAANDNDDMEGKDVNGWKKMQKKKDGGSGGFQKFNLSQPLLKGIRKRGFRVPTPIQRKAIPLILEGKDVVAMARTGSGKTAAFLIPLFEKLEGIQSCSVGPDVRVNSPRALIISPTRELATQTLHFFQEIGKFLKLKVASILGGDSMESQFAALHDKPDVIIATPGRFMHICVEMEFKLSGVEYVVFDEADRLFEMGFGEQLAEILRRLPENRQTLLFSATLPKLLVDFTKAGLRNPTLVRLDVDSKLPDGLALTYYACRTEEKLSVLLYLLNNEIDQRDQTIVFVATKHHVEYLHALLDVLNISNCYIYSSLDPLARKASLENFRNGNSSVMIVTDIAARGIDLVLDNVINFHFPATPKLFVHRVGRVARAGRLGRAYSIISPDEIASTLDLHLFLGRPIQFTKPEPGIVTKKSDICFVGRIPQELVDEEFAVLTSLENTNNELVSLSKVCKNGYSQYLKSKPSASPEGNKRAKKIEISKIPVHSSFGDIYKDNLAGNLVLQMQNYKPKATIFEIGPKAGSETHKIMKEKRNKDQRLIEKHRTTSMGQDPTVLDNENDAGSSSTPKKDIHDENFIHYLPTNHHSESGLSVLSAYDKEVQDAVMDLTGDDSKVLKGQQLLHKWDRKRKKFVSTQKDSNVKKIKTESGAWIPASYNSGRYKSWVQKSKVSNREADDDEMNNGDLDTPSGGNTYSQRRNFASQGKIKLQEGKNAGKQNQKRGRFRTEIKRPDEILKNRKIKEKNKVKNKSKSHKKKKR